MAATPLPEDPLLAVGHQLRQSREARGLSLRQLALQTRISTAVLEALERGWRDRLPEAAYLRTMLPLIEAELQLPAGSLAPALPSGQDTPANRQQQRRFTPGSIDVFSSWQGTVLYALLTAGLIYGLNLEQQRLAAQGRLSLRPIPPLAASEQNRAQPAGASLLQAFPELRPLELAGRGQGLKLLAQETAAPAQSQGLLELRLGQSSQVSLNSDGGLSTKMEEMKGELRLPLTSPFQLRLNPPPSAGSAVLWNGQPLPPLSTQLGQYQVPPPAAPQPPR